MWPLKGHKIYQLHLQIRQLWLLVVLQGHCDQLFSDTINQPI